jgi:hypothetical protein
MKYQKAKCPICKNEYLYIDPRRKPDTCGRKVCKTNYEYIKKHKDLDGRELTPDQVNKFNPIKNTK